MGPKELMIIGAAFVAALIWIGVTSARRSKERLRRMVTEDWGIREEKKLTDEDAARIRYFFDRTRGDAFALDDITWNDLDMDRLYAQMDRTFSSVGESVLYRMLRMPVRDPAVIEERRRLQDLFRTDEALRVRVRTAFALLGRTSRMSLWEYLDNFTGLKPFSVGPDLLCLLLIAAGIFAAVLSPQKFVILPIFAVVVSIVVYYRRKAGVETYYSCVNYVMRLVEAGEKVASETDPALSEYTRQLEEALRPLRSIRRKAAFMGSANTVDGSLAAILMDYLRMLTHLDLMAFSSILSQVRERKEQVEQLALVLGTIEAAAAAASFKESLPVRCAPEFSEDDTEKLRIEGMVHPFLPDGVPNDIVTERSVLVTGSNASGKSTFLKAVALSAVLAQTVGFVTARRYRARFYRVYSSMALRDDLASAESYFVVEIRSLKRILDALSGEEEVLSFVDEVLRGTNTVERIAASTQILRHIGRSRGLCFAATHDVELTNLLAEDFRNVHFDEVVTDSEILFPYQLREGPATGRNAIRLLSVMGYDPALTQSAEEAAQHFLRTGNWKEEA